MLDERRFLCDEMLAVLGRWLRIAGYDTAIAERGRRDRDLVEQAHAEGRILLTRDRRLVEIRRANDWTVVLACTGGSPASCRAETTIVQIEDIRAVSGNCPDIKARHVGRRGFIFVSALVPPVGVANPWPWREATTCSSWTTSPATIGSPPWACPGVASATG